MKSFKRFLNEQQQGGISDGAWWFRARGTLGNNGSASNTTPGTLGGYQSWLGFVRMLNMPQFMLDMYDYNGDGTIGDNDQELIFQIAEIAFQIYEETGEIPPPMTAADYLENWEYYSEVYGVNFPNPNGFIERPEEFPQSDLDNPDSVSGDSLGALLGITNWLSSVFAIYGPEFFQQFHPEFYEEAIRLFDFNGDGTLDYRIGGGDNVGSLQGDVLALYFIIYYFQDMGYNVYDLPGDIVPAENFQEFASNVLMFGDKSLEDYIPDGYDILDDLLANITLDYPTGPPPPPEETPQSQAPRPEIGLG